MDNLLYGLFILAILAEIVYFHPKREAAKDRLAFESSVLATIEGLYLSGINFGCTDFEMRAYAKRLIDKARNLPGNKCCSLLPHTTSKGHYYSGSTSRNDYAVFALLCIIEYAKEHDNQDLIAHCECMLPEAQSRTWG